MDTADVKKAAEGLPEALEEQVLALRERLEEADEQIREAVVARPLTSIVGAFLGGYFIGRLITRF